MMILIITVDRENDSTCEGIPDHTSRNVPFSYSPSMIEMDSGYYRDTFAIAGILLLMNHLLVKMPEEQ